MRIAVIGGGASGLVTAWLLDGVHEVVLLERQPVLGGHIRTLGRNLEGAAVPEGVYLDGGVVEFGVENFPTFHRLMERLQVPLRRVPGTTSLVLASGRQVVTPACVSQVPLLQRPGKVASLLPLSAQRRRFFARTELDPGELEGRRLGDFLGEDTWGLWLRLLTTYAYSIPFPEVGDVAAVIAVPMLRRFCRPNTWTSVVGGSYAYVERLLADLGSTTTRCGVEVAGLSRDEAGVELRLSTGETLPFDAVVLATPPDQVLRLLSDPSEDERRRFGAWKGNHVHTLIHCDPSPYTSRRLHLATEFDVVALHGGGGGYNARLDLLAGLPSTHPPAYGLAFGLDAEIDPEAVIARVEHHTPRLSVEALATREEIRATNGQRHTFIAGAWLGDGLHEGAVTSALAVSAALGGKALP